MITVRMTSTPARVKPFSEARGARREARGAVQTPRAPRAPRPAPRSEVPVRHIVESLPVGLALHVDDAGLLRRGRVAGGRRHRGAPVVRALLDRLLHFLPIVGLGD